MATLSDIRSRFTPWLILRLISVLLSIAALIMLASLLPITDNNSDYWADGEGSVYVALPFAGLCWSIIWHSIVLGMALSGFIHHAGADIAMDFIGWGLNWSMGVLLVVWVASYDYTEYACDRTYGYDRSECELARKVMGIEYTGAILTILIGAGHLALFVKGCIDTHHLRVSDQRAKFMELGGTNQA